MRINSSWSKKAKINYRVPQGSNLGLLFFLMYINDLPKSTFLNTTLFADDTYLSLSSSSLIRLKTQVNNEINKVDKWFRSNKLSLNYKKSSYLVINKYPQHSIDIDLEISMNNIKISRSKYVKFLGLWLDDDLKFRTRIQRLETHLAKYTGMYYRIPSYLKVNAMITLFYSFIFSKLQYGILTWGLAKRNELGALSARLSKMIKTITFAKKFCYLSSIFKALNILKINNIY